MAAIPVVVPTLIMLLKMAVPAVPKVALPIVAPLLGALIDIGLSLAMGQSTNPFIGAVLGSAGTGLREIVDQLKKASAAQLPPPKEEDVK